MSRSTETSMPGRREFVVLMAALMAANALAIDIMLPGLPAIGSALGVADANARQLVITFYLFGFGVAQIFYGPLADRFGRKRLLIGAMRAYAAFGALAALAGSMTLLLTARFLQGAAAAATRVLVVAVVRDRYSGAAMAQIMSLVMIIFMVVPVLAPSLGQLILAISDWRELFLLVAIYGLALALWGGLRIPETLREEDRRPLSVAAIWEAIRQTLIVRASIGNTIASTLAFGSLFAFIGSIQQIVFDVFGQPAMLGLVFGCIAGPMAISSYANSRLVLGLGARRLLLLALLSLTGMALLHLLIALSWGETIWTFVALQALTMACFGLVGANAGALAMQPVGHIAGTASAIQGLVTTIGGALIGMVVGQAFNGTTLPLIAGFAICGALATLVALWANPRLIEALDEEPARPA
jgi:DHA1 family bicyclomycin/chloramphenicol resistance-like MFS transporter